MATRSSPWWSKDSLTRAFHTVSTARPVFAGRTRGSEMPSDRLQEDQPQCLSELLLPADTQIMTLPPGAVRMPAIRVMIARSESRSTMRFFNTAGPIRPEKHYCIPALERLDMDEVLRLVRDDKYFVLHAPRQTGKTSILIALQGLLNRQGYHCLYATVEGASTAGQDLERAIGTVLANLAFEARDELGDPFLDEVWPGVLAGSRSCVDGGAGALVAGVAEAARAADRRDRRLAGRIAALGAPAVARGLPQASGRLSAKRGAVRDAGHARLPHGLDGQSLQHRREVAASGGLQPGGNAGVARPAYRRDGAGVHGGGAGDGLGADPWPAVAGERAGAGGLLRERGRARPLARRDGRRHRRRAGAAHPEPGDPSGPVGAQAQGGSRAAGDRAAVERQRPPPRHQPRHRIRAGSRPDRERCAAAHRQPDLCRGDPARTDLRSPGRDRGRLGLVRRRRRRPRHGEGRRSRRSSARTRSTGRTASRTRRPGRSFCCRRFCSGCSTAAGGSNESSGWVGGASTC